MFGEFWTSIEPLKSAMLLCCMELYMCCVFFALKFFCIHCQPSIFYTFLFCCFFIANLLRSKYKLNSICIFIIHSSFIHETVVALIDIVPVSAVSVPSLMLSWC